MQAFIAYLRVSTQQQGSSGLGLDAQRAAVASYASGRGEIIEEFVEVETAKGANALARRPKLLEALQACRKLKATLVIAKLDRLARNVAFVSALMESRVDFICADNPHATRLTLHILAAVAEHERDMISQRTKDALGRVKDKLARGEEHYSRTSGRRVVKLGAHGGAQAEINRRKALEALEPVKERLLGLRRDGRSVREIAETLNAEGIKSPGGGSWRKSNVHGALVRLAA